MEVKFIHLHNHTEYSLLDGMLKITDIDGKPSKFLHRLAKEKIESLAITDHGNMFGVIPFYNNTTKLGIKPIIGCELYITEGDRRDRTKDKFKTGHITVLVKDNEGYSNLVEMLSKAYLEGFYYHPRIDFELLEQYHKGLIFLSGCLHSLTNQYILEGKFDKAVEIAEKIKSIVKKENFYIELMDHNMEDEKKVIGPSIELAKKLDLEVVATNDCHFEFKEDAFAHEVHLCISTGSLISDKERMQMVDQLYFKSAVEMYELFKDIPKAIENTIEISRRCNFKKEKDKIYLPDFPLPAEYAQKYPAYEIAQFQYLKDLCIKGLEEKFGKIPKEYMERLEYELSVINKLGFSSYFLIVRDFINYARENGIPVGPGRGSGAGSIVSWALGITKIDPLKHNLLFERFLNPSRKTMPDLDIDFSDKGREEVINYVINKYGKENVANIITYGNIMAKTAIKDVGRVLGFKASETNKITKLVKSDSLQQEINNNDEIKKLIDSDKRYKTLFDVALKIEGLKRHTGVHAAGKVITDKPVYKYVPLIQREGVITTQYDGEILTELGLLKIDFLGLRTLSVIDETVKLIKKKIPEFDINNIPLDDRKTFDLLCEGKTTGVFQLESEGMKKLVKNLKPSLFSDISALVALFRPGPIEAGMIDSFVNRKHGKEKIVYDHPLLEDILKDTYGTIVYQEQVMEIAKRLSGFSPEDADNLRKAMGKKIPEEMAKLKTKFIEGAEKNKVPTKIATKIFEQMYKFAGYGFNKSHSVAYAMISYQTAYLKANYPLEFMISLLSSEIGHNAIGSDQRENKMITYLEEARSLGFEILPPDVNYSYPEFSTEEYNSRVAIRFALTAIKNIGENTAREIVEEREKNGKYKSINDFISRNNSKQINKKVIESLAKAGAFDSLFKEEEKNLKRTKALKLSEMDLNSSILMFNSTGLFQTTEEKLLNDAEILKNEKEVLGFYFSGNPLTNFRKLIKMISSCEISDIIEEKVEEDREVIICAMIVSYRINKTRKNENMCRIEIEDLTESINVVVFPKQFTQCAHIIKPDNIVVVEGIIKKSDFSEKKYEIIANSVTEIFDYIHNKSKNLIIFFEGKEIMTEQARELKELKKLLEANRDSQGMRVYFVINSIDKNKYTIETSIFLRPQREFFKKIEQIMGGNSWRIN